MNEKGRLHEPLCKIVKTNGIEKMQTYGMSKEKLIKEIRRIKELHDHFAYYREDGARVVIQWHNFLGVKFDNEYMELKEITGGKEE